MALGSKERSGEKRAGDRTTNLKRAHERLVDGHHSACIIELAAVVRGRKEGNQLPLGKELITVFHDLVRATDQVQIVTIQEFADNISSESEGHSSVVLAPALHVFVGIGPQQVTEETGVRDVSGSHDAADLFHGLQVGRKAAVTTKDLLVDDGCDRQTVEAIGERFP